MRKYKLMVNSQKMQYPKNKHHKKSAESKLLIHDALTNVMIAARIIKIKTLLRILMFNMGI